MFDCSSFDELACQRVLSYFCFCFWLMHISTFQYQDTTKVTQLNRIAKCFTRKSISRQWLILSPVTSKQKLTSEMIKKTKVRLREPTKTTATNTRCAANTKAKKQLASIGHWHVERRTIKNNVSQQFYVYWRNFLKPSKKQSRIDQSRRWDLSSFASTRNALWQKPLPNWF